MRILGLIPARGGSKGVPRKNIRLLCGKPLLQYTAEVALSTKELTRVILSTEDEEIAEVGRRCGLDVPFLRPKELAQDTTPTLPVVQHAIAWLEDRQEEFDAVCILQPTNPLRRVEDIRECIKYFKESAADSLVTMLPVPHEYNPHWVYFRDDDGRIQLSTGDLTPIPRRQDLPLAFHREGSIYITRRDVIVHENSLYGSRCVGYSIDPHYSANIDSLADWNDLEQRLTARTN